MYALKIITESVSALVAPPAVRRKRRKVLPRNEWPDSVSATVDNLLQRLPPQDQAMIRATKRGDLLLYQRSFGGGICNYYGLNKGNTKLFIAACGRRCKPADASAKIIEALWLRLQDS
ncbi:MAG: DUF6794 domain-containing protein [Pseudomonadota bacterium]